MDQTAGRVYAEEEIEAFRTIHHGSYRHRTHKRDLPAIRSRSTVISMMTTVVLGKRVQECKILKHAEPGSYS